MPRDTLHRAARRAWPAWGAAAWCAAFAVRGAYWASGGTVGIGTLAADLRRQALERTASVVAVLWVTVVVELFGVAVAVGLARSSISPARPARRWATTRFVVAVIAAFVLIGHGLLFSTVGFTTPDLTAREQWWYGAFWGPWFTIGGALFAVAAIFERRRRGIGPDVAARVGVAVGVALTTAQAALAITA